MRWPLILLLFLYPLQHRLAAEETADVVVYGGTPGGITAAIQTASMGRRVVLIEPSRHLGA